jgi:thiamine biosynthesis protein ThiS
MELAMMLAVNGKEYNLNNENIDELIKHFELEPPSIVIEKNGLIVHKEKYKGTEVKDGDKIGIVRFAGGN